MTKALLIVDVQNGFCPGGNLPVPEGDKTVPVINRLIDGGGYDYIVASQDWHPADHGSFASQHPGKNVFDMGTLSGQPQMMWPDHCVQGTPGAELAAGLPWERVSAVIRKGADPRVDSYSTFRNNWDPDGRRPPTGLTGYLMERGVTDVFICGLARDYCVKWSAEDAAGAGFRTHVIWDLTRPVDPASDDDVVRDLVRAGARIVYLDQLRPGAG